MALNPKTYSSSSDRQKRTLWQRIVALALKSVPEPVRQDIWMEAHGFTQAPMFQNCWYPPEGDANEYGMESQTAYPAKDCLVALGWRHETQTKRDNTTDNDLATGVRAGTTFKCEPTEGGLLVNWKILEAVFQSRFLNNGVMCIPTNKISQKEWEVLEKTYDLREARYATWLLA